MNPLLWKRLKNHGILMPWRTARVAKKADVPLSVACATLVLCDPWRQYENTNGLYLLGSLFEESGDISKALSAYVGGDRNALKVLEAMTYFKQVLGIE